MSQTEPVIEDSRAVEDLHHLRLMALLHELVREKGNRGAASVLGIDPRTVASCMKTGRLSWRVREALEQGLQSGAGSAAARQRERNDALEGRSEEMEGKLRSGIEEVRAAVAGEVEALREEHARSMRHVERRLVRLEAGRSESETPSPTGAETEPTKRRYVRPRTYPQLATPEAEPDEDLVYGDAAPVIVEWRRVRAEFLKTRTTLDRTEVQEPMLELTLPRRGARADAASGLVPLGPVRPAGSGLGADAGPQAGAGGAQPGVAAAVAAPRPHPRTVAKLGPGRWLPHRS